MKNITSIFFILTIFFIALNGCGASSSPTATPELPTQIPNGKNIIVTSIDDSGPGTLRQALLDAQSGDIIIFDPLVFSPTASATIYVSSGPLSISQGHLTIDASNARVILDGSRIPNGWNTGIQVHSNSNTIRGLQVVGFSGAGIVIDYGQNNLIEKNISCGNDFGIGLWGTETFNNSIAGNYLGVLADGKTPKGNRNAGITITEGANRNFIGPDNHIAFNGSRGIEIYNASSIGNTITQNSIHDNGVSGIYLWDGGNTELAAPVIFDFDLRAGTLAGTAFAGCTIEIFSDNSKEGGNYEGQTIADSNGTFVFDKGASFTGPYLTATTTDTNGNTSQFSAPTSGTRRSLVLQTGNTLPRFWLITKQSGELEDNRIGCGGMSDMADPFGQPPDLQAISNWIASMGFKNFRFTIVNIDGDRVDWDKPEFIFEQRHHDFITSMAKNHVMVRWLLIFRDDALGGEGRTYHPRFKTEEEIERYLDYVRFIVDNVKEYVHYFEIWNEPNVGNSVQWIEVEDYINLVRRVVPVIRQGDPQAKIALAGTTYLREPESRDYLFSILKSDVMPLVDVVAWHPMYGASPEIHSDYYYEYPAIVQQIKETASAHGFRGEYQADEICWWTKPEAEAVESDIWYSEIAAAKYHARGTVMHLGMDVGVMNIFSRHLIDTVLTNLCSIMAGAKVTSLPVEIEATNVISYSFSLPNRDYLVALWTDGVAVEDDPGINVILTLPDFTAREVVGIDVLYGYQQQIISDTEDGNLVVHGLLVKDYPIILRFIDVASSLEKAG